MAKRLKHLILHRILVSPTFETLPEGFGIQSELLSESNHLSLARRCGIEEQIMEVPERALVSRTFCGFGQIGGLRRNHREMTPYKSYFLGVLSQDLINDAELMVLAARGAVEIAVFNDRDSCLSWALAHFFRDKYWKRWIALRRPSCGKGRDRADDHDDADDDV